MKKTNLQMLIELSTELANAVPLNDDQEKALTDIETKITDAHWMLFVGLHMVARAALRLGTS